MTARLVIGDGLRFGFLSECFDHFSDRRGERLLAESFLQLCHELPKLVDVDRTLDLPDKFV